MHEVVCERYYIDYSLSLLARQLVGADIAAELCGTDWMNSRTNEILLSEILTLLEVML